jgi:hypothetical protein
MRAHRRSKIVTISLVVLTTWLVPMVASSASTAKPLEGVTLRAVLCFAPLPTKSTFSKSAALPECTATYRLTAKNVGIHPDGSPQGFTSKNVKPDPRFLHFPDSSRTVRSLTSDLLLSGIKGSNSQRFVLGPALMTSSSFKSAKAVKQSLGQWVVTYQLTSSGAAAMDALAKSQFHAYVAIVANGQVYSAPLIQPTQSHFSSFNGRGEVSGAFSKSQAEYLAQQMLTKNS